MKCQGYECEKKATLSVLAHGDKGWVAVYCDKCAGRTIRLRAPMIRRHRQNVTVRMITNLDKRIHAEARAKKRKKVKK